MRAAQDGAQARGEFAGVEGLGQIVIGAGFQTQDAVGIVAARRQHQYGHARLAAQTTKHLEAAQTGKHHVEDNHVEAARQSAFEARVAPFGDLNIETFEG